MNWHIAFAEWFLYSTISGLVILVLGGIGTRLCRQPVYRIRVIQWTLAGCLLIPVVQHVGWLPWTTFKVLPVAIKPPGLKGLASGTVPPLSSHPDSAHLAPRTAIDDDRDTDSATEPVDFTAQIGSITADATLSEVDTSFSPSVPAASVIAAPLIPNSVLVLFLLGAGLLTVRTAIGMGRCRVLRRSANPAPAAIVALFRSISGPAGQRTRLLVSDRLDSPITWGLIRPIILIPAALVTGSNLYELRWCLAHEWSHVKRRDIYSLWLASLAQLVCFYQPAFWWLKKQLLLDQDYLADAEAAQQGESAEDYAAFLVSLAQRRARPAMLGTLGIGDRKSRLLRRVRLLVQPPEPLQHQPRWLPTLVIAAVALIGMGSLGTLHLAAAVPAEAEAGGSSAENSQSELQQPKATSKPPAAEPAKPEPPKAESSRSEPITYTGKVIDRISRQPISGVTVEVIRQLSRDPKTGEWISLETTKHETNASGEYRFTLPSEQVAESSLYLVVDAHHPNYQSKGRSGYSHSMIRTNLANGEPPFYATIELSPGKPVFGMVETAEGKPLSGMEVLAYSKAPSNEPGLSFERGAFQRAKTDETGRFQFVVATPGSGVFWLFPKEHCPQAHVVPEERGNLGKFTVVDGHKLGGQILNAKGEPVPNVWINARRQGDGEKVDAFLGQNAVANHIGRAALTNDNGRFQLAALPDGEYRIEVSGQSNDPSDAREIPKKIRLDDVFIPLKVTLKMDAPPVPLEIRAVPHVVVRARVFRSDGQPRASHEQTLFGRINGEFFFARSNAPKDDGWFEFKAPHGLQESRLGLTTNEHSALRWRMTHDDPLQFGRDIMLGSLETDILGIEVIRYDAPMLLIKAVDQSGAAVPDFKPDIAYAARPAKQQGGRFTNGGDVNCEHQPDGRWRSDQLLPDEKFTVTVSKEGYTTDPQTLTLPEKGHQEITFVLRKAE